MSKKPPYIWQTPDIKNFGENSRLLRVMYRRGDGFEFKDLAFSGMEDLTQKDLSLEYGRLLGARVYALSPKIENRETKVFLQYDKFGKKLKQYQAGFKQSEERQVEGGNLEVKANEESSVNVETKTEVKAEESGEIPEIKKGKVRFARIKGDRIVFGENERMYDNNYQLVRIDSGISGWEKVGKKLQPIYKSEEELIRIARENGANMLAHCKNRVYMIKYTGDGSVASGFKIPE